MASRAPRRPSDAAMALYNKCLANAPVSSLFDQSMLLDFKIAKNPAELKTICDDLVNWSYFVLCADKGIASWKTRPEDHARKLSHSSTTLDERQVYSIIEATSNSGIWTRSINTRTQLAPISTQKALKKLASSGLIKDVRQKNAPTKKNYMCSQFEPDEDVTGGCFYDDGDLDSALIEALSETIVTFVESRSWVETTYVSEKGKSMGNGKGKVAPKRINGRENLKSAKSLTNGNGKRKFEIDSDDDLEPDDDFPRSKKPRLAVSDKTSTFDKFHSFPDIEDTLLAYKPFVGPNGRERIPYPIDEKSEYPSAANIFEYITKNKFVLNKKFEESDLMALLEVLENDGLVLYVESANGYASVKPAAPVVPNEKFEQEYSVGTGLTQAPCSICPVFDMCEDGGRINPRTCPYLNEWLYIE
ncbi:hypothetical protein K402DRAFT_467152 [Aulographum hederae CBS 113979]|uniref:DNA-directed RNA polymerase III subunit RPC6 n=1 Tax=Aulographum hederae CBS 113979 TaxID=1176131 RepID=A0A6G1GM74_9PEZI|nr:hypothetical protein K402DRAFT_467152 [Aulographum hederae CBS 113979]